MFKRLVFSFAFLFLGGCANGTSPARQVTVDGFVTPLGLALYLYETPLDAEDGNEAHAYWIKDPTAAAGYVNAYYGRRECDGDFYKVRGTLGYSKELRSEFIDDVEVMQLVKQASPTSTEPCLIDVSSDIARVQG